ncbi:hypothetical protein EZS27_035211, partial [termite gut metagenome]
WGEWYRVIAFFCVKQVVLYVFLVEFAQVSSEKTVKTGVLFSLQISESSY